ncbi:hypothetical protein L2E82_20260 [Cichorium intybus]|uniref:Uncharacterized protein n=1 Tax=Cichorium intybus TaxID=13427 RepID=A0ACB9DSL6_CICIN|nr:hypothetical protein L2E82_20260 [Cichorium intybus]
MRLAGVDREKDGFLHARRKTWIAGERRGFCEKSLELQLFVMLLLLPLISSCGELNADKLALLDFAAAVPNGYNLKWNPNVTDVCKEWQRIPCCPNGTRIISVNFRQMNIRCPIPVNTLGRLDALEVLDLSSNELTGEIPSEIASLSALRILDLSGNKLGGIPLFLSSSTVEKVDLSFNKLSGFIPELILPNLKSFKIKSNLWLVGAIPHFMSELPASSFEGDHFLCGDPLLGCWPSSLIVLLICLIILVIFYAINMAFVRPSGDGVAYFYGSFHQAHVDRLLSPNPLTPVLGVGSLGNAYLISLGGDISQVVKRLDEASNLAPDYKKKMQIIRSIAMSERFRRGTWRQTGENGKSC